MDKLEYIKHLIAAVRPGAKFIQHSHSREFIASQVNIGNGFFFVTLYDEKIDAQSVSSKSSKYSIIIHNTYLSSFCYNLLLCWLYGYQTPSYNQNDILGKLLKHNFKKFFAEQLLHNKNTVFSRAILLETLLYEQVLMVPVFKAKSQNSELNCQAELSSALMSSLISSHELGHYFLDYSQQTWDELLHEHHVLLAGVATKVQENYPAPFFEEFKCDAIAVITCLKEYGEGTARSMCIRSIVFGFVVLAVLFSLTYSAKYTTTLNSAAVDIVDFSGLKKHELLYDYAIGIDPAFIERAQLIIELCQAIAEQEGFVLFGEDGPMPLPKTILADLMACSDTIMDNDDVNSRAMSRLVAEALHEHPDGIEFLYMRSKTFTGPSLD